jgi:hypothetical protein
MIERQEELKVDFSQRITQVKENKNRGFTGLSITKKKKLTDLIYILADHAIIKSYN